MMISSSNMTETSNPVTEIPSTAPLHQIHSNKKVPQFQDSNNEGLFPFYDACEPSKPASDIDPLLVTRSSPHNWEDDTFQASRPSNDHHRVIKTDVLHSHSQPSSGKYGVEQTESTQSLDPTIFQQRHNRSDLQPSVPFSREKRRTQRPRARRSRAALGSPPPRLSASVLEKPLSEMALKLPETLLADPSAFSCRSIETRQGEAAISGKVKRPLNAFMLYRKTYQNVAKTLCIGNNHQQISSICGDSWKYKEPQMVVDNFNHMATVEREMHETAFPMYRYDPASIKGKLSTKTHRRMPRSKAGSKKTSKVGSPLASQDMVITSSVATDNQSCDDPVSYRDPGYNEYSEIQPLETKEFEPNYQHQGYSSNDLSYPGFVDTRTQMLNVTYYPNISNQAEPYPSNDLPPTSHFLQTFIDPTLLPSTISPHCENTAFEMSALQQHWPLWDGSQMADTIPPDLDLNVTDSEYLRGGENDWEVKVLEDYPYWTLS